MEHIDFTHPAPLINTEEEEYQEMTKEILEIGIEEAEAIQIDREVASLNDVVSLDWNKAASEILELINDDGSVPPLPLPPAPAPAVFEVEDKVGIIFKRYCTAMYSHV